MGEVMTLHAVASGWRLSNPETELPMYIDGDDGSPRGSIPARRRAMRETSFPKYRHTPPWRGM